MVCCLGEKVKKVGGMNDSTANLNVWKPKKTTDTCNRPGGAI
jgi:hypothetical protein